MIALRTDARRLPRVKWTSLARESMAELMTSLESTPRGRPRARKAEIAGAIELLRYVPSRGELVGTREDLTYRRFLVNGRFFVYYVYVAPEERGEHGKLSIRAVKHAAIARR